jgi:DNA gyrase subunit A
MFDDKRSIFFVTSQGTVKKTSLSEFANERKGGIMAITLDEKDSLIAAQMTDGKAQIIIATKKGMAIKFFEDEVRVMGRSARGVTGIRLNAGDEVIGACVASDDKTLLTITQNGYGKQTKVSEYRQTGRGGKGVINIKCTEKNGYVVAIGCVEPGHEAMLISKNGIVIRTKVSEISEVGRAAQGVRVMRLEDSDALVGMAFVMEENGSSQP